MDLKLLKQLITIYLELNPSPVDEQVHNLAFSLNLSKESLEEVMYKMMAEYQEKVTSELLVDPVSEFTKVLEDNYDPALTSLTDLASNDGDVRPYYDNMQEVLLNDGIGPEDVGLGININNAETFKQDMVNDGCVIMSSVLSESLLGSLDPVKDSLMHGLIVLQKARPVIVRHDKALEKQIILTIASVKEAVNEVKILMEDIDE